MKNDYNVLGNATLLNEDKIVEEDKEILLMIEYMKSKWTNGLV